MTTTLIVIVAAIAFIASNIISVLLYRYITGLIDRLSSTEIQLAILLAEKKERQQVMTDAKGRERGHHAWNTTRGLNDAAAVMVDAVLDVEATKARLETAIAILSATGKGPGAYNSNLEQVLKGDK